MSRDALRALFDCMVFAQALISPGGPAGACVEAARSGRVQLLLSEYVLAELSELPSKLPARLRVTAERVEILITQLKACCELLDAVPSVYSNPLDPDDSPYVDLAVAGGASCIVSRDKHMLRLMDGSLPAGRDFLARFQNLIVLTPEDLLGRIRVDVPGS